jgi:acetyltransferase-like isoleucine patch superfamily enzyme
LSSVIFDIRGNGNSIEIKEGSVLNNVKFYIRGNGHKIVIDKYCIFNCSGHSWNIWFEDSDCSLIIGERTTFYDVHISVTEPGLQIKIGSDCLFSTDVDIRTGDSHSIISTLTNERINYGKDVFIGDHVWVATHCNLLKGTFIAGDSVVATGSVVSGRYKTKGVIIGGNPSTQLMSGINWAKERIYKAK